MAFSLPLPTLWSKQRWKVKIRDWERLEPPHVTILHGTRAWRWNLRDCSFMDRDPDPSEVPQEIVTHIEANLQALRAEWDDMYPSNPVVSQETDDD